MEYAGRFDVTDFHLAKVAAAVCDGLWYIIKRVVAISGLLVCIYGVLAAEVELVKLEQVTSTGNR